jgi:2-polyprenyl-3-methyl-5-hydroxy-6-metoxy-1,4-benzoquinol methylase
MTKDFLKMYDSNTIWEEFWKIEDKTPIIQKTHSNYLSLYGGTNYEPDASIGMSCFLEPCRNEFKNEFKILDYGCGAGILSNFISLRLDKFTYVGLEPNSPHGVERINIAKTLLDDNRVEFGFIEEGKLQQLYKNNFDCIVLISVFTHLIIEDVYSTLNKLLPFLKNNKTKIIFSCFIDNTYQLLYPQNDINKNFYGVVKITEQQLLEYSEKNNIILTKVCDFLAAGNHCHNIYTLEEKNE